MFGNLLQRIRTIQEAILAVQPLSWPVGYFFFTILMLLATYWTGLLTIEVRDGEVIRYKGFWWELNWGFNHLIAIPLTLLFCAFALQLIDWTIRQIAAGGMAVDQNWQVIPEPALREDWHNHRLGPGWLLVIALLAFGFSWAEWLTDSALPVWTAPGAAEANLPRTLGWTTGKLLNPGINRWANILLSFVAFTAQGFVVTFIAYTYAMVLAFCLWVARFVSPATTDHFVPDVRSEDRSRRRGFERFERLIHCLLLAGLTFIVVLFCIRIQAIYDHSQSKAPTGFHFILEDAVQGFFQGVARLFGGDPMLFDTGTAFNQAAPLLFAAMLLTLLIAAIVPAYLLAYLAKTSQEELRKCMNGDCPPCLQSGLNKDECRRRREDMDFWPLSYPRALELLAYVVSAGFCFIFYRFTFLLAGILTTRLVFVVVHALWDGVSNGGPPPPPGPPAPPAPPAGT